MVILDLMTATSLLLIEAHDAVRGALRRRLERVAHLRVVGEAKSVLEALPFLEGQVIDVVLLGVSSLHPAQNASAVRKIRQMTNAPLIVLMPYVDEVELDALQAAENTHYLLKQVNTPYLIEVIDLCAHMAAPPPSTHSLGGALLSTC